MFPGVITDQRSIDDVISHTRIFFASPSCSRLINQLSKMKYLFWISTFFIVIGSSSGFGVVGSTSSSSSSTSTSSSSISISSSTNRFTQRQQPPQPQQPPPLRMSTDASTTTTIIMEEVKVGDAVPTDIVLTELTDPDGTPQTLHLSDLCHNKKVLIFGVPGAFTPGCSKSHLPSFIQAYDTLTTQHGVDSIICMATNDAYTMEAWGRTSGATSTTGIRFCSDHTGSLTRTWGLALETPIGLRTKRFSLIVENGIITHYFSSAQQSSDTWAPAVLAAL
jgi:peroxiredoxin 5